MKEITNKIEQMIKLYYDNKEFSFILQSLRKNFQWNLKIRIIH